MFDDERIVIESGKIFRKANVLSILISLLFLVSREIIYISNGVINLSFGIFSTELCTLFASIIIILYGEIKYINKDHDERISFNKFNYYSKKGKILLLWIIIGYAISMIESFKRINSDMSCNYIIIVFECLG